MSLPEPTEKDFLQTVRDYAVLNGWKVYHTHDSRRSSAGFPDLVLVRGAWLIFAELKVGHRALTSDQWDWFAALEGVGKVYPLVKAVVWRPRDWPEIERLLVRRSDQASA